MQFDFTQVFFRKFAVIPSQRASVAENFSKERKSGTTTENVVKGTGLLDVDPETAFLGKAYRYNPCHGIFLVYSRCKFSWLCKFGATVEPVQCVK
jgi:hypothetical protein